MPIHDWKPVDAGIFHAFHHGWIEEIARALNRGLLPKDYYALPEQIAGGFGPDVLTLKRPIAHGAQPEGVGGVALVEAPPKVRLRFRSEPDSYSAKAKAIVIRHASQHQVIAVVEIVSPGNKNSRHVYRAFVEKAVPRLRAGVHLMIVDLFEPGPRDPDGIHKAIWDQIVENDFGLPDDEPLTLASYLAGAYPEAFVETCALHARLADMPLFLSADVYIPTPLEPTYQAAFESMPEYWRDVMNKSE